jgi:hypothetical protein
VRRASAERPNKNTSALREWMLASVALIPHSPRLLLASGSLGLVRHQVQLRKVELERDTLKVRWCGFSRPYACTHCLR